MSDLYELRLAGLECSGLEAQMAEAREYRDGLALAAVDAGFTWREVAEAAGFANPYIAHLKRRREQRRV